MLGQCALTLMQHGICRQVSQQISFRKSLCRNVLLRLYRLRMLLRYQ